MFILKIQKVKAELAEREALTCGSVGVNTVRFDFDESWQGLSKTAVFSTGERAVSVVLDSTDSCIIPWEVLEHEGARLTVGVYGTRGGDMVMPTELVTLGRVNRGTVLGEEAAEPTPSVYAQMTALMQAALDTAEALRRDADEGRFDGGVQFAAFFIDRETGILSVNTPDGMESPAFQIQNGYLEVIL